MGVSCGSLGRVGVRPRREARGASHERVLVSAACCLQLVAGSTQGSTAHDALQSALHCRQSQAALHTEAARNRSSFGRKEETNLGPESHSRRPEITGGTFSAECLQAAFKRQVAENFPFPLGRFPGAIPAAKERKVQLRANAWPETVCRPPSRPTDGLKLAESVHSGPRRRLSGHN